MCGQPDSMSVILRANTNEAENPLESQQIGP
jgi:hypothetical protein